MNTASGYSCLRRLIRVLGAGSILFLFALVFTSPVAAQGSGGALQATCVGPLTLNFSPGLGLFTQLTQMTQLTGTGQQNCVFTNGAASQTAQITNVVGNGSLSCLVNGLVSGNAQFNWSDGTTSVISWSNLNISGINLPPVQRVFVLQGTVLSGKFQGDSMLLTYNDIPSLNYLNCLTNSFTTINGIDVVTFTQISL